MIITRTPFRVSLFGGGTDYPSYYRAAANGGAVIGFALDRYCYLTVRRLPPFFAHRHRLVYSRVETVGSIDEISHPTARAVLAGARDRIGDDGLEIHHDGDLPARAGLGSSSSFVVGLLAATAALYGRSMTPIELWREAVRIERDVVGEVVGVQDQAFASFGGVRRFRFYGSSDDGKDEMAVDPCPSTSFLSRLVLVFTGMTRIASAVARSQEERSSENRVVLDEMRRLADEAWSVLAAPGSDVDLLGEMLHEGWQMKRSLSPLITNDYVEALYAAAREAGATGGKLLGAGGGGFLCLWVTPDRREAVRAALRERVPRYVEVPAREAPRGCTVVLEEPNGL